jgi:hypothetical protein
MQFIALNNITGYLICDLPDDLITSWGWLASVGLHDCTLSFLVYNRCVMEKTTDQTAPVGTEQFTTHRGASAVSSVANPLFVAIPTFLVVALSTAPNPLQGLLWWGITVLGFSLAPLLFIARGVRSGRYSDRHVSLREQRLIPLLFGIGCVVIVFLILLSLRASPPLMATVVAALITSVIATLVTRFWTKISFHLIGIAGTATVFTLLFGIVAVLLYPLVLLVGWARWRVQAHTVLQACAGTVLAVVVTLVVFWLFALKF